jgi:thiamine-phosphate pyrophosphorylase
MIKSYLITDPSFYQPSVKSFSNYLQTVYQKHHVDFACFRDKKNQNIKELAYAFLKLSSDKKTLINGDVDLAYKLGFFGVHLRSDQFDKISEAKSKDLFTIISTHTKEEVRKADSLGVDAITYSPIFETPNKGKPKGIEELKEIVLGSKLKVFALGGIISNKEIAKCIESKAYGFASIRYFN